MQWNTTFLKEIPGWVYFMHWAKFFTPNVSSISFRMILACITALYNFTFFQGLSDLGSEYASHLPPHLQVYKRLPLSFNPEVNLSNSNR